MWVQTCMPLRKRYTSARISFHHHCVPHMHHFAGRDLVRLDGNATRVRLLKSFDDLPSVVPQISSDMAPLKRWSPKEDGRIGVGGGVRWLLCFLFWGCLGGAHHVPWSRCIQKACHLSGKGGGHSKVQWCIFPLSFSSLRGGGGGGMVSYTPPQEHHQGLWARWRSTTLVKTGSRCTKREVPQVSVNFERACQSINAAMRSIAAL